MRQHAILWITPKWPLPINDGARVATKALLDPVSRHCPVTLLALAGEDEIVDLAAIKKVYPHLANVRVLVRPAWKNHRDRLKMALRATFNIMSTPLTFLRFLVPDLSRGIAAICHEEKPSAIVCDGLHPGATFVKIPQARPEHTPLIYRAHNAEHRLWEQMADQAGHAIRRIFLQHQANLMRRWERQFLSIATATTCVAPEDLEIFRNWLGTDKQLAHIPIGLQFRSLPFDANSPLRLLFLGRLDWPPNREGLEWFLTEVWARIKRDDIVLAIAGSGDSQWLERWRGLRQLEILGEVPDPTLCYERAHAAIAPIFWGSGTRVKTIEPAAFNRACIATSAAIRGAPLSDREIILADTAEEWLNVIDGLTMDQLSEYASRSRERLQPIFDQEIVAKKFLTFLHELRPDF